MKKIFFILFIVPFIIIPILYAILIPAIDFLVYPTAPTYSFNLYDNNGFIAIWGGILVYHSAFFLIGCWLPFCVIQNAGKNNRIIRSMAMRWFILSGLLVIPIMGSHLNEDFFKYGNSSVKWVVFYILAGFLLSILPVRWLYLNGDSPDQTN